MSTNRRDFLKLAGAAAAAITSAAAAHAGVPASSVAKFDDEYDVVIIGSGFAGMACALKAGQAGKKVLILEKMPTVGGNSAICGGNVACPVNPVQAAQGIKDSKELFIADCLKDGLGINYPNLLGTIADRCNDTIKMVVECGCEFVPNKMLFEAGHSVPRSYEIKAGTGSGYIIPMHNELKKLPNVKIMTRAKFDDFILDENGRVVGVTYRKGYRFDSKLQSDDIENKSGRPATVKAKNGVMLAAGGFSRDIFFRQAQDPRVVPTTDSTNQPGATAGVLIKALGIGAQPVQLCWLQFLPYCNPREKGFGVSVNFTNHACMDLGLVVDRKTGKRFMDEHAGRKIKSDALFKVIGTDENYPIAICDDAIVKAINPSFVKLPLEMGTVKKFDTLEQLADAFGIPKQALLDEVAKFNGYVKANDDKDFHRILTFNKGLDVSKAPFYGIEVSPKIHHTMGGVMINENAEVISANTHKPIPGLYAGGEVAGGVHGASRLGTVAVIDALTFGMIAGENFVKMQ
ncbi:flavocytochrome c [Parasutterella sp.]|uniref:flavocytochrome c n=1 Tax=Parasutterella sp. TaxID=2049037 RepID=UPI003AB1422D